MSATIVVTAIAATFLVASEVVFFATKPSFLSRLSTSNAALTSATAIAYAVAVSVPLAVLGCSVERGLARLGLQRIARTAGALLAAALITGALLLIVDTFSYTLFEFGVIRTRRGLQLIYLLALGVVLFRVGGAIQPLVDWLAARASISVVGLSIGFASACMAAWVATAATPLGPPLRGADARLLDVILLSGDGIELRSTSLDGYERDTTPFLSRLASESLVSHNHFTNVAATGGSVVSLLTGRGALATGVIDASDSLQGRHAFEHLPGLLKGAGYQTLEASMRVYADSADLNLREGFDRANRRSPSGVLGVISRLGRRAPSACLLLERIRDRLSERVLHILFLRNMLPLNMLVKGHALRGWDDRQRVDALLTLADTAEAPYFAHVHLMGSHGPLYRLEQRRWSQGQRMDQPYLRDFYDDAILDFDRAVERVYSHLEQRGRLDRTLLIVNSDHGVRWATGERLPLLIRFPKQRWAGSLDAPTQRIDIAPTVLDALGLDAPLWMEGRSLLPGENPLPLEWPIFAASHFTGPVPKGFGALGSMSLIECGRIAQMILVTDDFSLSRVPGHMAPCPPRLLASPETARAAIVRRLREYGYATDGLGTMRAVRAPP